MMAAINRIEVVSDRRLMQALGISLLLHLLLLLVLRTQPTPQFEQISVELKDFAPKNRSTQIVSPPQSPEAPPIENKAYLSERDARAEHEQIRRGVEEKTIQKAVQQKAPPAAQRQTEQQPQKSAAKITSLHLNQKDLDDSLNAKNAPRPGEKSDAERNAELMTREPFSQQSFKELFLPRSGSPDFLQDIPDGDITLLNTKADRFAVFVRRVANQVFGNLRKLSWQDLPASEIARIHGFVTVHAVMTKEGKLLSLAVEESSGNSYFDRVLKSAVEKGAWDQNPPAAALAKDGNIHFVFKARSWVRGSGNRMYEQRWILLGTGLL